MPAHPSSANGLGAIGLPAGLVAQAETADPGSAEIAEGLIGIDEVQRALNRSRASVYRYTNTDPAISIRLSTRAS